MNFKFLKTKYAEIYCHLDQEFRKESSLSISKEKDLMGRYSININFYKTDRELYNLEYVKSQIAKIFYDEKYNFIPNSKKNLSIHHANHHSGTMKMGSTSDNGVVDKNLKVFGFSNLYVCDSSIFPNFGNSNPVFTILAFASRLRDHLNLKL